MKRSRIGLAMFIGLAVAATASAQTPQQIQRQRILQTMYYQQMAAQQALYPMPFSPAVSNLSYVQFANQAKLASGGTPLPVPSTTDTNAILNRAQMLLYAAYPQAMATGGIPLNYLTAAANNSLGTFGPLPAMRIPTTQDEYNRMVTAQQQALNYYIEAGIVMPSVLHPQAGAPARMLQGAVFQGLRQLGLAGPAVKPWHKPADAGRGMQLALFREAPGERELELGRLWSKVDVQKARELFVQAEGMGDAAVIEKARKELKALADKK